MEFNLAQALRSQGKAIAFHPALADRATPVSVYSPGASRQEAKLSQREAALHQDAYGGVQAMDSVMNAVDLYATSASAAQWRLERPDGTRLVEKKTKHTPKDVEVGPEELYFLLKRPNPFMLYDELISLFVMDLLLVGNAYWLKWRVNDKGQPLALYRLAPAHVKIIPGPWGPVRYEYQPPGTSKPLKLQPKDILHFKLPNPHDAYYGMGVVRKGGRAVDLELAVTETMAAHYENRADPSLVVQSERRVPRDVFNKLRAQLRGRVSGPAKSGELLVLEAGLKAETLTTNDKAALFEKVSGMSQQRVYAMFRTHPKLFGITSNAGEDKVVDVRREFDTYVMRPFLDKIQLRVTEYIAQAWDVDFKIDYNYVIPQDELLKNVSTVAAIPGLKVRELRRFMLPLGFLDGESTGDPEIDEEILNMPMEEMDENGQGGAADRPLAGEAGRPPKGENTSNFRKTRKQPATKPSGKAVTRLGTSPGALERLERAISGAEAKALESGHGDNVTISVGRKLQDEERPEDRTLTSRSQAVDEIAEFIQTGLAEEATKLERAMLDHAEGKAFTKKDVVKRMRQSQAWVTFREGVERILTEAGKRALQASVMDQAELGRVADDLDYDAIVKGVVHRKEGLPSILRTAKNRLIAKVANLGPEATKAEADAVIQEHIAEWKSGHAETIAIAEAVELYNEGTLTVAEETGAEEVFVFEEEDAPDEPCQEARNSVWPIEYAREHRKEHPRCRRAFSPLGAVS